MPEFLIYVGQKQLPALSENLLINTKPLQITDIPFGDGKQFDQTKFCTRSSAEYMVEHYPESFAIVERS